MSNFPNQNRNFNDIPLLSEEFLTRILRQVGDITVPTVLQIPAEPVPAPKPQKRCPTCKHKLMLSDMACRCGLRHCGTHRLPETHGCTFDHKTHDRKVLEAQVVRCVADKLGEERI